MALRTTSSSLRVALLVVTSLLCSFTNASPQATDPTYEARRAEIFAEAVPRIAELALECRAERYYAESDELWERVLVLDPEHRKARKALRYYRNSEKGWYQSRAYKKGKNRAKKGLPEMRVRIDVELHVLRDAMLIALDKHRRQLGRERVEDDLAHLALVLPKDPAVHGALGEVWHEGRWLLAESVTALKRREAFPQLARACLKLAPKPEEASIREEEQVLGLPWNAARKTEDVRVLGTTGEVEVTDAARVSHAVGDYFRNVLATERRHRDDFTIYMLFSTEKALLLAAWPGLSAETSSGLQSADGGWLDSGNRLAEWSTNPARRIDGAARQTLGTLLLDTYGIDGRHGWAWEGVGLYMVHELVGTRLTWFFDAEGYTPQTSSGLWTNLQLPNADWFAMAKTLYAGGTAPNLTFLLGRKINAMREVDVLVSYVLAAYLLEGHPREAPEILRRVGEGQHPVYVFEEELGYSMRTLEKRLGRWLEETW